MYEREIVQKCLEKLRLLEPVEAVRIHARELSLGDMRFEGSIEVKTTAGNWNLAYESKKVFRKVYIPQIVMLKEALKTKPGMPKDVIVCASYISPPTARLLREKQINFVDFSGNAFLNWPEGNLFLYIEGQKPEAEPAKVGGRLYQNSGLRVLFALLTKEGSTNLPYRELADFSGTALGSVGWIMRELREKNYLLKVGKGRYELLKKDELLSKWVEGYKDKLRPHLVMGTYRSEERDLEKVADAISELARRRNVRWALSGGFGADQLVHYYRGEKLVIYFEGAVEQFLKELRWLPSTTGNITVLRLFSPSVVYEDGNWLGRSQPVADPLLIYAELIHGGTDRELETAQLIRERYLEARLG